MQVSTAQHDLHISGHLKLAFTYSTQPSLHVGNRLTHGWPLALQVQPSKPKPAAQLRQVKAAASLTTFAKQKEQAA